MKIDRGALEQLVEVVRDFVTHFGVDHPCGRWEKLITDDGLRFVGNKSDVIFWDDANHRLDEAPDEVDSVRFDKIVALANAAPAILSALAALEKRHD